MDIKGMAIDLVPGANIYVVPPEKEPEPPLGFIDNTVYRYKIVDGEKVLIGTIPAFPEGWDSHNNNIKNRVEENVDMSKYDWTELWPEAKALLDTGKRCGEVASELKIDRSALYSKMYREGYILPVDAALTKQDEVPPRKAATINQDFEKAFPPLAQGGIMSPPIPFTSLGPSEEIKPISAPYGVEIPKQEEQLSGCPFDDPRGYNPNPPPACESQYRPEDNDFQDELPSPYQVVVAEKVKPDLGPIKIQLVATLLAEYRDGMIDADITLGLTRGILDLQLPEVI